MVSSMLGLTCITAEELAVAALIIGIVSAKRLSTDELNVAGNFVVAVGCIMLIIAAQEQFLKSQEQKPDTTQQIQELQQQIQELQNKAKAG